MLKITIFSDKLSVQVVGQTGGRLGGWVAGWVGG